MRPRKFLLVTKALTTAGLLAACRKEDLPPPPGNPKGSWAVEQDGGTAPLPGNPKWSTYDAAPQPTPPPPPSASTPAIGEPIGTPPTYSPPGNPKGSHYDGGKVRQ